MTLNNAEKKHFRAIGHKLKPVVSIAQKGLTENIRIDLKRALDDHELIKIKLLATSKEEKKALMTTICDEFNAQCVQSVGHMVLLYLAAKQSKPRLSNLKRSV